MKKSFSFFENFTVFKEIEIFCHKTKVPAMYRRNVIFSLNVMLCRRQFFLLKEFRIWCVQKINVSGKLTCKRYLVRRSFLFLCKIPGEVLILKPVLPVLQCVTYHVVGLSS